MTAERRELVVSREALLALGAAARGERAGAAAGELAAQGVLGLDGRVSDAAAPTAVAVGSASVTVNVLTADPDGNRGADLWVGGTRAVLHGAGNAPAPVVSLGRSLLPELLVRAIGLAPRPVVEAAPFAAAGSTVAAACRGSVAPPWTGQADRPSLCRVSWAAADGTVGRLAVLDLGAHGYWSPADQGGELTWSPTTASAVWQAFGPLFALALDDRTS
jgi:hypothetical protein